MDIYIVKGYAHSDGYNEKVELLDGMEDKPKSYVGLGKRIDKIKIDKMESGNIIGSYQIALTDKEKINEARKRIKEKVVEDKNLELKKLNRTIDLMAAYSLDSELKIREY